MARLFHLVRDTDVSGVSGIGHVAEGVEFYDGRIVLNWCLSTANGEMSHAGLAIYDNLRDCLKVHGHNGATRAVFHDINEGIDVG